MTVGLERRTVSLVDHGERFSTVRHLLRPKINITDAERIGRIVMGTVVIVAGVLLLMAAASVVAVAVEVLLVASGLDLLITGATGHCPLYQRLHHMPKSLGGGS